MSRIELGPIRAKVCQCEFCGRIRGEDGLWIWDDSVKVDVLGFCSLCGKSRADAAKKRDRRLAREVSRKANSGELGCRSIGDPFKGFRGE